MSTRLHTHSHNQKGKRINLTFNINGKLYYTSNIYFVGSNYKYKIGYSINSATYNNSGLRTGVEKMLTSFSFEEPNATSVGKLFDTENEIQISSGRPLSSTKYKWSLTLPSSFTEADDSKDADIHYLNNVSLLDFSMDVCSAKKTLDEYAADSEKYMKGDSNYTVIKTETLRDKDTTVKKVIYKYVEDDNAYYNINYFLCKNGNLYDIYFSVPDYRYSDYSNSVFKSIWDSMNF